MGGTPGEVGGGSRKKGEVISILTSGINLERELKRVNAYLGELVKRGNAGGTGDLFFATDEGSVSALETLRATI